MGDCVGTWRDKEGNGVKIFLRDLMFLSLSLFAANWCLLGFEVAVCVLFETVMLLIIFEKFLKDRF